MSTRFWVVGPMIAALAFTIAACDQEEATTGDQPAPAAEEQAAPATTATEQEAAPMEEAAPAMAPAEEEAAPMEEEAPPMEEKPAEGQQQQ